MRLPSDFRGAEPLRLHLVNQAPRYGNDDDEGIARLTHLVRGYLIVRVAGYSDYFCDLSPALQDEIIARTEHAAM